MNKEEILNTANKMESVRSFLSNIIGDEVLRFEIENYNEGCETITVVTRGRCDENHYDTFNLDKLLGKL